MARKQSSKRNEISSLLGRRRFLGWATALSATVVMGLRDTQAALFYSTRPVEGIPQSWVDAKGLDVLRYANYIKGLKLKNVTPQMVLAPHFKTRGSTRNSLPPRYMWSRIAKPLRVIDSLSSRMNASVRELLSIYRSPSYNRAVRGRSLSQHMENRAIDVKFHNASPSTVAAHARRMRREGHFKGGVGRYSSFTHIDTRGHNADW